MHSYARANHKAGKLDEAERLLRAALQIRQKGKLDPTHSLGWLSRNLVMQGKHAEAEPFAREVLALVEKEVPTWRRFVVMTLLGRALLGQGKHAAAEPLLLQGYEGLKEWEAKTDEPWRWRLTEATQHIVDLYEATNQPEKATKWREKLTTEKALP
jgi:hypothetical protein